VLSASYHLSQEEEEEEEEEEEGAAAAASYIKFTALSAALHSAAKD
jgi:hypothetical protein